MFNRACVTIDFFGPAARGLREQISGCAALRCGGGPSCSSLRPCADVFRTPRTWNGRQVIQLAVLGSEHGSSAERLFRYLANPL